MVVKTCIVPQFTDHPGCEPEELLDTTPLTAAANCSAFAIYTATSFASGVPAP
jgi:hypothetical protein